MPGMVDLSFFCSSGVRPVSSAEKKASAPSSSVRPMMALMWRTLAMLSTRSRAAACCGVRQASRMTSGRWKAPGCCCGCPRQQGHPEWLRRRYPPLAAERQCQLHRHGGVACGVTAQKGQRHGIAAVVHPAGELFCFQEGDILRVGHYQLTAALARSHNQLTEHRLGLLRRGDADAVLAHHAACQRSQTLHRAAHAVRPHRCDGTHRHLGQCRSQTRVRQLHHRQRAAGFAKAVRSGASSAACIGSSSWAARASAARHSSVSSTGSPATRMRADSGARIRHDRHRHGCPAPAG